METILRNFYSLGFLLLISIWIYFIVYSYLHRSGWPWGFSILLIAVPFSKYGFSFYDDNIVLFYVSFPFVIILVGLLWNIVGIRNQLCVRNTRRVLIFSGIGLLLGLLEILLFFAAGGMEYIEYTQGDFQYSVFAIIAATIQKSIAEEFAFRGYLLGYLKKYKFSPLLAILFQSFVFTVLHIVRYSDNWVLLFVVFFFGNLAGYITWKSNNLIPASIMHVVVNLFPVIWTLGGGASL